MESLEVGIRAQELEKGVVPVSFTGSGLGSSFGGAKIDIPYHSWGLFMYKT